MKRASTPKSETELSALAAKQIESMGFQVLRIHAGKVKVRGGWMQQNRTGTPDRAVMLSGSRVAWLEAKYGPGELSPEQRRWHALAERLGHVERAVRTVLARDILTKLGASYAGELG